MVGAVHSAEVSHLKCVPRELEKSGMLYGCLNTLAMGDCQAVELAQSCHLSMGLQHQVIKSDTFFTFREPLPRSSAFAGLIIDDFISFAVVDRDLVPGSSDGAKMAEQMLQVYKDVKLIPNEDKSFRDKVQSSFWGVDLDGESGLLRGSLRRAIPLFSMLIEVAEIGQATGDLLQILCGSLISLFLFRRRFLSLMDPLFAAVSSHGPREVFALSGKVKSCLLTCASLLPVAVTNLRAAVHKRIGASDASNWGEAGVACQVPRAFCKEMLRHTLQKSIWVKLLAPAAAWLKSHGQLPISEEVPVSVQPAVGAVR